MSKAHSREITLEKLSRMYIMYKQKIISWIFKELLNINLNIKSSKTTSLVTAKNMQAYNKFTLTTSIL